MIRSALHRLSHVLGWQLDTIVTAKDSHGFLTVGLVCLGCGKAWFV